MAVTPVVSSELDDSTLDSLIDTHAYAQEMDADDLEGKAYPEGTDYVFYDTATEVISSLIRGYADETDEEAFIMRADLAEAVAFSARVEAFNRAMDEDPNFKSLAESNDDVTTAYNTDEKNTPLLDGPWPEDLPTLTVSTVAYDNEEDIPQGNVTVIGVYKETDFVLGLAAAGFIELRFNPEAQPVEEAEEVSA